MRTRAKDIISYIQCRSRRLVVALSGGVDSAVLTHLAVEALGREDVLAVTGRSPSLSDEEAVEARSLAETIGVPHRFVDTHEMRRDAYRANAGDRCYHCRVELFDVLEALRRREGFDAVAYGAIRDDAGDDRPGMRAADERRILAPLLACGVSKEEVRAFAFAAGLEVHDKPASACLASRLPAGTPVTEERLAQVARAERALRGLGFRGVRVRHHDAIARVELDPEEIERAASPDHRETVCRAVRAAGFRYVVLDLEGYRPGGRALLSDASRLVRIDPSGK